MKNNKPNTKYDDAWKRTLKLLQSEVSKSVYDLRLKDTKYSGHNEHVVTIHATDHHVDWLNARIARIASNQIQGILNEPYEVLFTSNGNLPPDMSLDKNRKAQLVQSYGDSKASIIQPSRALFITFYYWKHWRPLLGKATSDVVIACRSLGYWNIKTGELRNRITTDRDELARVAGCSPSSVDRALNNKLVKMYFVRKRIARIMTDAGPRNHGLILRVRMDDPLTPEHQEVYKINEPTTWYDPPAEDKE